MYHRDARYRALRGTEARRQMAAIYREARRQSPAVARLLWRRVRATQDALSKISLAICLALSLSGCIPLVIGGYIGYRMAESDAHKEWCAQHVGDPSCEVP